jgi:hypothetical protein
MSRINYFNPDIPSTDGEEIPLERYGVTSDGEMRVFYGKEEDTHR